MKLNQDGSFVAGKTARIGCTVTDPATGLPKNIDGGSIVWAMAPSVDGPATLQKTSAAGEIQIDDGPNGHFVVTLPVAETKDLAGPFVHQADVTDAAGDVASVMFGTLRFRKSLIKEG